MSYVEQGVGKRFGSLSTFLLQLDPTCFLDNKKKKSISKLNVKNFLNIFLKIIFHLDEKYNMLSAAYHQCKYLANPKTRNMRKKFLLKEKKTYPLKIFY